MVTESMSERRVTLIGGPMDGYDEIIVPDDTNQITPVAHHRYKAECQSVPVYFRKSLDRFTFSYSKHWRKDEQV